MAQKSIWEKGLKSWTYSAALKVRWHINKNSSFSAYRESHKKGILTVGCRTIEGSSAMLLHRAGQKKSLGKGWRWPWDGWKTGRAFNQNHSRCPPEPAEHTWTQEDDKGMCIPCTSLPAVSPWRVTQPGSFRACKLSPLPRTSWVLPQCCRLTPLWWTHMWLHVLKESGPKQNSWIPHTKSLSRGISGGSSFFTLLGWVMQQKRSPWAQGKESLGGCWGKGEAKSSHGAEGPDRDDRVQLLPFVLEQPALSHSGLWGNTLSTIPAHKLERKGQGGIAAWLEQAEGWHLEKTQDTHPAVSSSSITWPD